MIAWAICLQIFFVGISLSMLWWLSSLFSISKKYLVSTLNLRVGPVSKKKQRWPVCDLICRNHRNTSISILFISKLSRGSAYVISLVGSFLFSFLGVILWFLSQSSGGDPKKRFTLQKQCQVKAQNQRVPCDVLSRNNSHNYVLSSPSLQSINPARNDEMRQRQRRSSSGIIMVISVSRNHPRTKNWE